MGLLYKSQVLRGKKYFFRETQSKIARNHKTSLDKQ